MTSFRETSTQTECSPRGLMKELLEIIDVTSQPEWGMSPIGSPPESESDSDSLIENSSTGSGSSSEFYWEDETNPGGEGPPPVPPQ
uniref:ORF3 n=1 Tax=Torque teno Leptonychotes weddellii virus-1 TaxID=2012676 RepID=A0A1Z2RWE3_9VIRU|nr:ORF3 [Torque teno Leptonychotes weddellii virus 1]